MTKFTSFKCLGSAVKIRGTCQEDVNHPIRDACLIWQQYSGVWSTYDKFGKDLKTAAMKMCLVALGVTKLDRIKTLHIRGTLHIEEAIVDKA